MKKCNKCNEIKSYEFFSPHKRYKDGYQTSCKNCRNIYAKKYYLNNTSHCKEKIQKWKKENKNKINKYYSNRKANNPLFKLRCNIGCLISNSITKKGYSKNAKTYQILGCTFEEFKEHLVKQFTKGMTWENQGKWHLDHIYPVSLAKDEEEVIKLNHYTNFQPMWAIDNIKKSNKIIEKQLTLL